MIIIVARARQRKVSGYDALARYKNKLCGKILGAAMRTTFTEAFAKYGASLTNPQWSFSAIAEDGALVLSCWQHKISMNPETGVWRYSDCVSRFKQKKNVLGRTEFVKNLQLAYDEKLPVRLVIVSTTETAKVDAGEDVSGIPKDFDVRVDRVGQVVSFDGDSYIIDFQKTPGPKNRESK